METAENIAKSCKLIQQTFQVLKFKLPDDLPPVPEGVEKSPEKTAIQGKIQVVVLKRLREMVVQANNLEGEGTPKALLIEGSDLTHILRDDESKRQLANLAKTCEAVVCCRLLPIQKAEVVQVVRTYLNKITLAIGDGANDVPMIKTAHIGIGLYG